MNLLIQLAVYAWIGWFLWQILIAPDVPAP